MKKLIYLDNHATTPVDPRVLELMLPFFQQKFGNAASSHWAGREVRGAVAEARQAVASLIGADSSEIIFTSGATESNNLAIKGLALARQHLGRHLITCKTEHKSVLDSCQHLRSAGFELTYLPVDHTGTIDTSKLVRAIRKGESRPQERTILVSIMHANNEIGTIQSLAEIGAICQEHGLAFHVDAAQSVGREAIDVRTMGIDLLSLSGHKVYGPKGVGALYVRSGLPALVLEPQLHGGGQEFGLRSGTLAVPLVVGLGKACELARIDLEAGCQHVRSLRDRLQSLLLESIPNLSVNGHPTRRLPGNLHVSFDGLDFDILMGRTSQIACSTTSACSSASDKPSHVLKAIGLTDAAAMSSVRLGIGRMNTQDDIDLAAQIFIRAAKALA